MGKRAARHSVTPDDFIADDVGAIAPNIPTATTIKKTSRPRTSSTKRIKPASQPPADAEAHARMEATLLQQIAAGLQHLRQGDLAKGTKVLFQHGVVAKLTRLAGNVLRRYPRLALELEPEELVNEAYERLTVVVRDYKIDVPEHFLAIARKNFQWTVQDMLRRMQRNASSSGGDVASADGTEDAASKVVDKRPGPDLQLQRKERTERILAALRQLTTAQQELLKQYYFDGRSFREIAVQHAEKQQGVVKRCNEAHRRLRELLKPTGMHKPQGSRKQGRLFGPRSPGSGLTDQ